LWVYMFNRSEENMSISHERRVEAAGWALETLETLGHPSLMDALKIEWKAKFTARLGDALYKRAGSLGLDTVLALRNSRVGSDSFREAAKRANADLDSGLKAGPSARVRFSIPLWSRATPKERYETVVHEICHIVANHEAALKGTTTSSAHGWEWKNLMRKCGVKPERCHNVDRTGLKRTGNRVSASCGCGAHNVTPYVAGRIAAGATYTCRKCHKAIVVHVKVAPVAKKGAKKRATRRTRNNPPWAALLKI